MTQPTLTHIQSFALEHDGDCSLLGVSPDMTIYLEEIYTDDGWVAQHAIHIDGTVIDSVDEDFGRVKSVQPLDLPPDIKKPMHGWQTKDLNFVGPRHRGMKQSERVADMVQSLTMPLKMFLTEQLGLKIMPPQLFGLAESYVISEVELIRPQLYIVCRRLRFAYALPEVKTDSENQPYDYETTVLHVAHFYDKQDNATQTLHQTFEGLPGPALNHPTDCVLVNDHLFISDSGHETTNNAIHIWQVDWPADET